MKAKELAALGIPNGDCMHAAIDAIAAAAQFGEYPDGYTGIIGSIINDPDSYIDHKHFSGLAIALKHYHQNNSLYIERESPAPYKSWGSDFEEQAITQMKNSCRLPISVRGALMPDAHVGYGLPIGGVLATRNAVIPYAVGVDIACRMKMTVLDLPVSYLETHPDRLKDALIRETQFGVGASFKRRHQHKVLDEDWSFSPVTNRLKDKAWSQLGTSGSGNHFAEFGLLTVEKSDFMLKPGMYLALLSHSGSRGTGNEVARYYSKIAMQKHSELPKELSHLSWLTMTSHEGREYWKAMELMGKYASANHELIHRFIARHLGVQVLLDLENHHNFAWKENHSGEKVIVHRKGATPAGKDVFGIIPGSMATPGYVVRGKGNALSLNSASHGAGRKMSRKAAKQQFNWHYAKQFLRERGVTLLSAGLDEVPMAYKDIDEVMKAQAGLVEIMAKFEPRLVRMAREGERPED